MWHSGYAFYCLIGARSSNGKKIIRLVAIIENGQLSPWVEDRSIKVFALLAEAEATVHGTSADNVHFHEVGSDDSIICVVGALISCEYLGIERIRASALHLESGFIECAHGRLPIPAPATGNCVFVSSKKKIGYRNTSGKVDSF